MEFALSFYCVPEPPHRNFVFACGYVAPFFSSKSSNFVFFSNIVVFAFFSCFFSVFSVFVFSVSAFLRFVFFGTLSVLTPLRFFSGGRGCLGVFPVF